jgi:hypothetical protein
VRKKFGRHEGAFTVPSTSKVTEWHASDSYFRQNNSGATRSIPGHTKQRILAAAKELSYCPNYSARSLRLQRTWGDSTATSLRRSTSFRGPHPSTKQKGSELAENRVEGSPGARPKSWGPNPQLSY